MRRGIKDCVAACDRFNAFLTSYRETVETVPQEGEPGKILIAPQYIRIAGPLIFLAGPIRGAADWQKEAIDFIKSNAPGLNIASPRRSQTIEGDFPEDMFNEQLHWEHYYLKRAADNGVILFWLPKEAHHRCDRSYAQTTRFELGEASAMHHFVGVKVVVGAEEGFTGRAYIVKTLAEKCPRIPLRSTLEETCQTAIMLAKDQ